MTVDSPPRRQIQASKKRRVFYAVSGIVVVMVVGIVGFHYIEGMRWVDALYMESMLATGQGPPISLSTDYGKIFASIMGFVSVGTVFASLIVTLVPIVSQLWREGLERLELDARTFEQDVPGTKEKDEQ
jgi:hypothetical protein